MTEKHTPMVLMATEGLLDNTALAVNPDIQPQLTLYLGQTFLSNFSAAVAAVKANQIDSPNPGDNPYGTSAGVVNNVIHALDDKFAGASNTIPEGSGVTVDSFNTFLNQQITNLSPSADNGVYLQRMSAASGYAEQMNEFVNSAVNGQDLNESFNGMDALSTANIALVSTNTQTFGEELQASGDLYNFENVDIISTPQGLAESMSRLNVLTSISAELEEQGINAFDVQEAIESNPELEMKPLAQKRLYNAYLNVTGAKLEAILLVMEFETTGIETLADLLDIRKVFPNSYGSLQVVTDGTTSNIFDGEEISTAVQGLSSNLEQSFPSDQAKAAQAFSSSLGQIKAVHESNPRSLGEQAALIEKNDGLDEMTGLTEALPADTTSNLQSDLGGGSGPDGTFFVTDLVGTPAGIPHVENLTTINTNMDTLTSASAFISIEEVFTVIAQVANGVHDDNPGVDGNVTIPPGLPAEGFWPTHDAAINALLAELDIDLDTLTLNYPAQVSAINDAFEDSWQHIYTEIAKLSEIPITFVETYTGFNDPDAFTPTSNKQSILGFAGGLPQLGTKTDKGNVAEILEKLATDTRGGQAIIGAMREGRNAQKFNEAGIQADNKIDSSPKTVIPGDIT